MGARRCFSAYSINEHVRSSKSYRHLSAVNVGPATRNQLHRVSMYDRHILTANLNPQVREKTFDRGASSYGRAANAIRYDRRPGVIHVGLKDGPSQASAN